MLKNIKDMVLNKKEYIDNVELLFESTDTENINDLILLNESQYDEMDTDEVEEYTDDGESEDNVKEIDDLEIEDDDHSLDTDELSTMVDDQTSMPGALDNDVNDFLNVTIDLKSNTINDILPVPPSNASDTIMNNDIMDTKIDSGFSSDDGDSIIEHCDFFLNKLINFEDKINYIEQEGVTIINESTLEQAYQNIKDLINKLFDYLISVHDRFFPKRFSDFMALKEEYSMSPNLKSYLEATGSTSIPIYDASIVNVENIGKAVEQLYDFVNSGKFPTVDIAVTNISTNIKIMYKTALHTPTNKSNISDFFYIASQTNRGIVRIEPLTEEELLLTMGIYPNNTQLIGFDSSFVQLLKSTKLQISLTPSFYSDENREGRDRMLTIIKGLTEITKISNELMTNIYRAAVNKLKEINEHSTYMSRPTNKEDTFTAVVNESYCDNEFLMENISKDINNGSNKQSFFGMDFRSDREKSICKLISSVLNREVKSSESYLDTAHEYYRKFFKQHESLIASKMYKPDLSMEGGESGSIFSFGAEYIGNKKNENEPKTIDNLFIVSHIATGVMKNDNISKAFESFNKNSNTQLKILKSNYFPQDDAGNDWMYFKNAGLITITPESDEWKDEYDDDYDETENRALYAKFKSDLKNALSMYSVVEINAIISVKDFLLNRDNSTNLNESSAPSMSNASIAVMLAIVGIASGISYWFNKRQLKKNNEEKKKELAKIIQNMLDKYNDNIIKLIPKINNLKLPKGWSIETFDKTQETSYSMNMHEYLNITKHESSKYFGFNILNIIYENAKDIDSDNIYPAFKKLDKELSTIMNALKSSVTTMKNSASKLNLKNILWYENIPTSDNSDQEGNLLYEVVNKSPETRNDVVMVKVILYAEINDRINETNVNEYSNIFNSFNINSYFDEAITLDDTEIEGDIGDEEIKGTVPEKNEITSAVLDKVNDVEIEEDEIEDTEEVDNSGKDDLLKKLGSITKNLEDAKKAVMDTM